MLEEVPHEQLAWLSQSAILASPAAGCRCAATISTPIASCRRGSCAPSRSKGSSTPVRRRPRGRSRAPVQRPALRRRVDPGRQRATSAAVRRASTRRRGCARFGIRAIVGESFSEIFQGNSAVLGIPCFVGGRAAVEALQALVEAHAGGDHRSRRRHGRHHGRHAALRRRLPRGAARRVPDRSVESDGDAARPIRRSRRPSPTRLPYVRGF